MKAGTLDFTAIRHGGGRCAAVVHRMKTQWRPARGNESGARTTFGAFAGGVDDTDGRPTRPSIVDTITQYAASTSKGINAGRAR